MKTPSILIAVLLLLLPFLSTNGERPSFREKVEALEQRAQCGDANAMYHLSTLYFHGYDSIAADSLLAMSLLRESARLGNPDACNELGFILYPHYPDSALNLIRRAAEAGNPKALNNLAFFILSRDPAPDSIALAAEYLDRAASAGIPSAMTTLADLYREGRGIKTDSLKARTLYLMAAKRGFRDAERKLLDMDALRYDTLSPSAALAEGLMAADAGAHVVAVNLYRRASEGGIPRATALLADAYSGAKGVDYDNARARRLYLQAAREGDPSAQFIIAELLEIFPDILRQDSVEGEALSPQYWYDLAARDSVTDARQAAARLFASPSK